MSRIKASDSIQSSIIKLSDGNPGAISAAIEIARENVLDLLACDRLALYGAELYMLWNDCCNRDAKKVNAVLAAWRHGKLSEEEIHHHLEGINGIPFDLEDNKQDAEEVGDATN